MNVTNLIERNGRVNLSFEGNESKGVRIHNCLTALFVRLFGSGIVSHTTKDGAHYFFNRGSLITFLQKAVKKNHDYDPSYSIDPIEDYCPDDYLRFIFDEVIERANNIYEKYLLKTIKENQ